VPVSVAADRRSRIGVLAFGDSITNAGGELQWGVALQSWALWVARGLGVPYTGYAVDGARAPDVIAEQIPAFRRRNADAEARFDLGCLYIGVNDVRSVEWDTTVFTSAYGAALEFLAACCDRVLTATAPLTLGVPPAGADVAVVDPLTRVEAPRAEFDENGRLTNAGFAIGEIVRRDAGIVFEGYYKNEEATSERNRDGWYWSGDLGYRDHEGVFYFAGRTADWMRVDGENFAAAPIERIISRHPDVGAVAVYGVPDPVTGDQVMAAVELRAGRAFDAAGFGAFLDAQRDLGTKWAPRFVRIVDALPVTGADKIAKLPLRAAGWTQAPHVPGEVWWRPERGAGYELLSEEAAAGVAQQFARHGRTALLPPADETSPT